MAILMQTNGSHQSIAPQKSYTISPTMLSEYNDLLSVEDLCAIFEVAKSTVYKEMKAGKFGNPIQIGRAYKVPKIYVLQRYFLGY